MKLLANYHTHSLFCDGKSSPQEIVEEAIRQKMTHLGFSGHMDSDIHMDFEKYTKEIRKIQKEYRGSIEVLCGVELDTLYDSKYASGVDYVIGSTHFIDVNYERPLSIDNTPEELELLCNEFYGGDYYKLCKEYYELEATVVDRFPCAFIGHFDLITKFNNVLHFIDEENQSYLQLGYDAAEHLIKKGVPFEVNTRQVYRNKLFPSKDLLRIINQLGGNIIISSDAHDKNELLNGFGNAIRVAKECGYNSSLILKLDKGTVIYEEVAFD